MRTKALFAGLAVSLFALVTPVTVGASGPSGNSGAHAPLYYLALGDSLSVGWQPTSSGAMPTNQGYTNDVASFYQASLPNLQLVELGCPGESTTTMIHGGICPYDLGSQLAQAVNFLHAHGRFTPLVTIDIGANNVDGCVVGGTIKYRCIGLGFTAAQQDLPVILAALHAASPSTNIYGMNYYDPYLAAWFLDGFGPLTGGSLTLTAAFNALLGGIYGSFAVPVADVATSFKTYNEAPTPPDGWPTDVFNICVYTWMCSVENIHANASGYALIARTFEGTIGPLNP